MKLQVVCQVIHGHFYRNQKVILHWLLKTTVYKAALSTLDDLYNLVTKNVTKYAVLATYKILKIIKKHLQFFYNFENFISC